LGPAEAVLVPVAQTQLLPIATVHELATPATPPPAVF